MKTHPLSGKSIDPVRERAYNSWMMPGRRSEPRDWRGLLAACVAALLLFSPPPSHALTQDEEIRISREFRREAKKHFKFIHDPEVALFVDGMGRRILKAVGQPPYAYRFFVIKDPTLNAFAVPGGSIYIHTGLIQKVSSADELASVMAHEIVHVNSRHIARMAGPDPSSLLGILGIFLGAAGPAAIIGQAIAVTRQLEFTRRLEEEADNLGVRYLAKAGYDPNASVQFMRKMFQETLLNPVEVPPYLLTHPLSQDRIGSVSASIRSLGLSRPRFARQDNVERIQVLIAVDQNPEEALERGKTLYEKNPTNPQSAHLLGLAYAATGRWAKAKEMLEKGKDLGARGPEIERDLGRAYTQTGQYSLADHSFQRALKEDQDSPLTYLYLGELAEKQSVFREAARNYFRVRQLVPLWPEASRRLSQAYRKLNRPGDAHYYLAQSYLLEDEEEKAIESLQRALREYRDDSPRIQVIEDEIEAIRATLSGS